MTALDESRWVTVEGITLRPQLKTQLEFELYLGVPRSDWGEDVWRKVLLRDATVHWLELLIGGVE